MKESYLSTLFSFVGDPYSHLDTTLAPFRSEILTSEGLQEHARGLASGHTAVINRLGGRALQRNLNHNQRLLEYAYFLFAGAAKNKETVPLGVDWLLDNYHSVEEHITDMQRFFPPSYCNTLPKLTSGPLASFPRVYEIAVELLAHTDSLLKRDIVSSFVSAYQQVRPLTIGELWAIPLMCRAALIENLTRITLAMQRAHERRREADLLSDELLTDEKLQGTDLLLKVARRFEDKPRLLVSAGIHLIKRLGDHGPKAALALRWIDERLHEQGLIPDEIARAEHQAQASNQISIGNTVSSLKLIAVINWRDWFEEHAHVEPILRSDPHGSYARCDFLTRDRYRGRVELLSRRTGLDELEVARKLIEVATHHAPSTEGPNELAVERRCHIGYFLIDEGAPQFEKILDSTPPPALRIRRFVKRFGIQFYFAILFVVTVLLLRLGYLELSASSFAEGTILLLLALLFIPATEIANNAVQWLFSHTLSPERLPRLDFSSGIPDDLQTVVTVHAIFNDGSSIGKTIEGLEVRFLANDDKNLRFGLLADLRDADSESQPDDDELIAKAEQGIRELNARYSSTGDDRFFLMFRRRLWNAHESKFMGWERKRGKICEFNRFIRGDDSTTLRLHVGNAATIRAARFVITLDLDSQLPRESAAKLIGTIAHPLNRPVIDKATRTVIKGYGIIQPRMGLPVSSAHLSRFSELFSGHSGLDPYTQTVSDVYQDLFDEGSFVGKGIYDIEAFSQSVTRRVPENSLLSHDLFEGLFARVALASDIELLDEFPSRYHTHSRRQHRWVRGDWQLLPWLRGYIRDADGNRYRSPLRALAHWKIVDNLRRSLVPPTLLLALVMGWALAPRFSWGFSLVAFLVIAFPLYARLANALVVSPLGFSFVGYIKSIVRDLLKLAAQTVLLASFLPYQALLMLHAIAVTLYRVLVSRRNLLEWETAYHSDKRLRSGFSAFIDEMLPAVVLTGLLLALLVWISPTSLPAATPFLVLWIISPFLAAWSSEPLSGGHAELSATERRYLQSIAHDTWCYFDELLTQEHHYLIPDNIQLVPHTTVADRTSPTNIGLSMMSVVAAYDLGFIPLPGVPERLSRTFTTLQLLERYRGHFLNWYQTTGPRTLAPRYISFVDSANFVGHLMTLQEVCKELAHSPLVKPELLSHLADGLAEIGESLTSPEAAQKLAAAATALRQGSCDMRGVASAAKIAHDAYAIMKELPPELSHVHHALLRELHETARLSELCEWCADPALQGHDELAEILKSTEGVAVSLRSLDTATKRATEVFESRGEPEKIPSALRTVCTRIHNDLELIRDIAAQAGKIVAETDFTCLYDQERKLFTIGYNLETARPDNSYYDLLASEARLGSLVAIALGQAPQRHWFALGRQLADSLGGKALVSWSGTMFEYMMPNLITKGYPQTLLTETCKAVVKTQQLYGKLRSVPWGLSESAHSGVDFHKTYQYRAFGVPGLGLKRGLVEDLVISPYSTMLALPIDTPGSLKNLHALEKEGTRGKYGFYESIDYTSERVGTEKRHIVRSFFAHHQGMSLISISNVLLGNIFQERFHRDPRIKATELLLQERFPERISTIVPHQAEMTFGLNQEGDPAQEAAEIVTTPHTPFPRTAVLSNGSYSVMLDNTGSGWSFIDREISLTRWREDVVSNSYGSYIYVRDLDTGNLWSTAYQPTRVEPQQYEVIFNPDKIEYKRRDFGIYLHSEITVSPEDNVEVRRVTLTNLSDKRRHIELTSFAEVALAPTRADAAHPAFSKMFVQSEHIPEFEAVLFSRRPRSRHEATLHLLHTVVLKVTWGKTEFETSRDRFIGRGRDVHSPKALDIGESLSGQAGPVLDPIFSLRTQIEIEPRESQTVVFITAAARDRDATMHLCRRYHEMHAVSRAFEMALSQSNVEIRQEGVQPAQIHAFQKLANALFFNLRELRAPSSFIVRNRLAQPGMWRLGISGDCPIVLLRVSDPEQVRIVREFVMAHRYLRLRGVMFDLLIINEYPGGYTQAFQEELEHSVKSSSEGALIDKKGGVFIRTKTQMSEEEITLLQAVARVTISAGNGPLQKQLTELHEQAEPAVAPPLPLPPRRLKKKAVSPSNPPALQFFNGIGGFSSDGKEYSILVQHDTLPPLPWINVIANQEFGFTISETGGGYTWCENSRENRLTPWHNDPVSDPCGEAIYLRDNYSGEIWSPTPRPVPNDTLYRVTHGMGFSSFDAEWLGIQSSLLIHGAESERVKWWRLTLTNREDKVASLSAYLYLHLTLGIQPEESSRMIITSFDTSAQTLCAVNHYNNEFAGRWVYAGTSESLASYTTDRQEFIGNSRDLSCPAALQGVKNILSGRGAAPLSRRVGAGFSPCAALQVKIDLEPGETREVLFFVGEAPNVEEMRRQSSRFRVKRTAQAALESVKKFWHNLTSTVQVKTPDRSLDLLLNSWLLYQTMSCRMFGRSALYQSGGAFGFRDQLQDSLAVVHAMPELVRRQILLHASRQYVEGDVQHWWHPPTGRGVRTRMSDDLLWLPYVVDRYIEKTGDRLILEEEVSFIESSELPPGQMESYLLPSYSPRRSSIYDHCVLAIERGLKFGPHGIPCIGSGDWNDGMNEVGVEGKGESIWLGWFLYDVLKRFARIAKQRRDEDRSVRYEKIAADILAALEAHGWDGKWYLRAFFDNGAALGSAANTECRIDSIAQSWSIISGAASPARAIQAFESAWSHLVDEQERIALLLTPAFNKSELEPGYIKGYLPGVRENGGQYTHAACWLVIACAMLERGSQANKLFGYLNPINHTLSRERAAKYMGEPYVLCGDVYSVPPHQGRAGWSWYTGSSGWLYQAGLEHLLGVRIYADYIELVPCIPSTWDYFKVEVKHGKATYQIEFENPHHVECGIASLSVNGNSVDGNRIVFERQDRSEGLVKVKAVLGK